MSISIGPKIPVMVKGDSGDTYLTQMNAFLRMAQALLQLNVINLTTSAPPGAPNNGDTYIVKSVGTGAWAGHDNAVAYWSLDNPDVPGGEWEFYTPQVGWILGNRDDKKAYIWDGAAWSLV